MTASSEQKKGYFHSFFSSVQFDLCLRDLYTETVVTSLPESSREKVDCFECSTDKILIESKTESDCRLWI